MKKTINKYIRSDMAWCMGLHEYDNKVLDYKKVVDEFLCVFRSFGLEPHAAGAGVPEINSSKVMTLKGALRRLEKRDFKDFYNIDFYAMENGEGDTMTTLGYLDFDGPLDDPILIRKNLTFELDKQFVDDCFDGFYNSIQVFVRGLSPQYGYALTRPFQWKPLWYIKASTCGKDDLEFKMIQKWENHYKFSEGNYKPGDFRDIYLINVLSQPHMDHKIDGLSFSDWIAAAPHRGHLDRISNHNWIWNVKEEHIPQVREEIRPTGHVICI